jgi:hypothetical protein
MDVTFQALVPREEQRRQGRAERMGFSGVVVSTPVLPPLGAILELGLPVGGSGRQMRLFAEVKWLDPNGDGDGRFGAFFLLPTTGRMLDLVDLHFKRDS